MSILPESIFKLEGNRVPLIADSKYVSEHQSGSDQVLCNSWEQFKPGAGHEGTLHQLGWQWKRSENEIGKSKDKLPSSKIN